MYRKMVIALIVVGSLIIGYSSLTQASHNCNSDSTVSATNPELNVACKYHSVVASNETELPRAIEASVARYSAMAGYYAANSATSAIEASAVQYTGLVGYDVAAKGTASSTFLAANPELMTYNRYTAEQEWHRMHFPGR